MPEVELVDLVDVSGNVKQRSVPRSEIELYPDLHLQIVIGVVFNKEGSILVHQRAKTKKVNPGDVDHVCGGVISGEKPEDAMIRESMEETGIRPLNVRIVVSGINKYNRYRYLVIGGSGDEPDKFDQSETEWARFMKLDELKSKRDSGEYTFVDEFFEDTQLALRYFQS